jgi:hypothetical protein
MPTTGLEPVRHFWHWSLKPACLPISARGHARTSARRGTRTLTGLLLQDPESCASTISAIRACSRDNRFQSASGAEGNRTPDLLNAIQALSQLSYSPGSARPRSPDGLDTTHIVKKHCVTGLTGLEPAASGVTDRHSNRLSYSPPSMVLPAPYPFRTRAGDRTRTGDLLHGKQTLYQLSYARDPPCLRPALSARPGHPPARSSWCPVQRPHGESNPGLHLERVAS